MLNKTCCNGELNMKRTLMGLLIVALLVGAAVADPFIGPAGNPTLRYSINIADGVDMTALGDTDVDFGTGDVTTTGAGSFGTVTETGGTTGTDATYSGTVTGDALESVNDTTVGGNLGVTGTSDFVDAATFEAPIIISVAGIAPMTLSSNYWIQYLNADDVDGMDAVEFIYANGSNPLTANWDVGAYTLTGTRFISDIAGGTAPFGVTSTTKVDNLNSDLLDDHDSAYFATASDLGTVANLNNGESDLVEAINATDVRLDTLETDTGANVTRIEDAETAIGTIANLDTTATDLVGAINETAGEVDTNTASIGTIANLDTTATDLVGAINETAGEVDTNTGAIGTLASLTTTEKGSLVGAINELDSPPMWHLQTITTPALATADEVLDATDGAIGIGATNIDAANMTGVIDASRCVILTPGASMTGNATLFGTNIDDEAISENVDWAANATATTTTSAFKTLTWCNVTSDTSTTLTIDYSDKLGLAVIPDHDYDVMFTYLDGVQETTLPTVVVGATVEKCNLLLDTALDGSDVVVYVYEAA